MSKLKRTPSLGTMPSPGLHNSISTIESPSPTGVSTLNRPAQASQSLFPMCLNLLERLYCVKEFEQYLIQGQNAMQNGSIVGTPTSENGPSNNIIHKDPVTLLWQTFRLGYPLCALFNALQPQKPLKVAFEEDKPGAVKSKANANKASVYHFLVACKEELNLHPDQAFSISQLYQDDTNGFVKVINTVKLVTDKIEEKGLLDLSKKQLSRNSDPEKPTDNRAKVVRELLETERKYVQDMEALQNYARELKNQDVVSADTIHLLFANLNNLVDFQRRFLIGVESMSSEPPAEQRFGHLFIQMEENFAVYEPFCANYQSASELVIQETPNLQKLAHLVEPTYELPSLLIKPIQRICKYPLLLQELLKFSNKEETPYYEEIEQGLHAIKRVTDRVNETRRKQENEAVVRDLERRVEDWKGHRISQFGELLLEDIFTMSKDDSEREYHVYLFEKILLCCKETNPKKSQGKQQKNNGRKQKRASLQLKGRIFIRNITAVMNNDQEKQLPNPNSSRHGSLSLKVYWKGDTELESFLLKCRTEEQLKQWQTTLDKLLSDFNSGRQMTSKGTEPFTPVIKRPAVSNTQLASLQNLDLPPYPRRDDDAASFIDDEEDEDDEDEIDDWNQSAKFKSQSLPYGQYPSPYGKNRQDGTTPPYLWNSGSPPSVPSVPPQHRSHANMSMPPIPRNGSVSVPPTMTTFPSNVVGENSYLSPSPQSYPDHPSQRQNVEHPSPLADTIAKFMMAEEDEYVVPSQRANSYSEGSGQPPQRGNGPLPSTPQYSPAHPMNRLRSQSNPPIQAIQESQWEESEPVPDLPTPVTTTRTNVNVFQSSGVQQRDSGSSTSSRASVHSIPNATSSISSAPSNNGLSSPPNGHTNGHQYTNYSTMKIKVNYAKEIFVIVVSQDIEYKELCDRVERKIRLCSTQRDESVPLRIRYQDEDGDYITINSDEDVLMAFEGRLAAGGNFVNLGKMKCSKCSLDKLSREFPSDIVSQKCGHVSTYCLKCLMNHFQAPKDTRQCPECQAVLTQKEIRDLNNSWEKAPFRIDIENISQIKSSNSKNDSELSVSGNATAGSFYVVLLNGQKMKFELENLKTVIALKEALKVQTGVEVSKQKLIHKGVEMNSYNTGRVQNSLGEYGIASDSHIQLIVLLYSISKELSVQNLTFDLFWGYPVTGCDYLDGTCMLYMGNTNWRKFDYQSTAYPDIRDMKHSGDVMDHVNRRGHHRITANLANLPENVTKLYFILSSWNSPNIGHFPNPSFKMYDTMTPHINLCTYTIQSAASSQAVIMCCVGKNSLDGTWAVYEVGKLSNGNAKNYAPIEYTIGTLDPFFIN
ncbi:17373_t:CDS:10 [Acaulospora morrowiae]|uniref:17373_t:CDS:1 n=1 Tax=Acaulospora morrowiae TaxID=94023 RepID=A0A9N8Z0V9_9GLOM|nr:17373_t:CDS:10 [Acaulospora morrowiae]